MTADTTHDVSVAAPRRLTAAPFTYRLGNVLRLHATNPWTTIYTPWLIFLAVFGLNVAIWYAVAAAAGGKEQLEPNAFHGNGGGAWILGFLVVVAVQSMSLTFRFALGMGFTRRDYYLGTVIYHFLLALMFATGITVLAQIEDATDGWGVGGHFFSPWGEQTFSGWQSWYLILTIAVVLMLVGIAAATMWVRWAALGLYIFFGVTAVLTVGAIWLITWADKWGAVGDFFTGHSAVAIVSMTIPLGIASGVFGYFMLRRATPKG